MDEDERESQENILRLAPVIQQAVSLRRAERFDESYDVLRPYFERNEMPRYFSQPAGWTIYRYIKANMSTLPPQQAKEIFDYYLRIANHQADMVNSYIMILAISYKKQHSMEFDFADFCHSFPLASLRDEDYKSDQGETADGRHITYQSTAVKAATLLYKDLKRNHTPETVREFLPFFERVKAQCPDYEYTQLYIANMHYWLGNRDEAIGMFRNMLVDNQQWYVWKHLGDLLAGQLRLSCYCKALTMMDKEEYLGELHLALATVLSVENPAQAAFEVEKYMSTCREHNWRIKGDAYALQSQLQGVVAATNGSQYYKQHLLDAENYVFGDKPQAEFVYTGNRVNRNGKRRACLSNRHLRITMTVPFTPELNKASVGDVLLCRYTSDSGRSVLFTAHNTGRHVNIRPRHNNEHPRTDRNATASAEEQKEVEGRVRIRDGQPYAFVDNYYISPHLRQSASLQDGQHIHATVAKRPDGRWRVIRIRHSSQS